MFVGSFEATLHSFYTVLSGTCARHQMMRVGNVITCREQCSRSQTSARTDSTSLRKFNVTSWFSAAAPTRV